MTQSSCAASQTSALAAAGDTATDMDRLYAIRLPAVDGVPALDVRLAMPPGDRPSGGWPVLMILEGEAFFDSAAQVAGRLLRRPSKTRVDAMIVAGISLGGSTDRVGAYAFTPGQHQPGPKDKVTVPRGAALLQRLTDEVLPRLAVVGADTDQAVLMGHSMSGLFVLEARAARAPFARFVSISPSIWWNPTVVAAQPPARAQGDDLFVTIGAREEMQGLPPAHMARCMISNARNLLLRGGVSLRVLEDEDHGSTPYAALPSILRFAAESRIANGAKP